jgi:hypothetical protein
MEISKAAAAADADADAAAGIGPAGGYVRILNCKKSLEIVGMH